jgi:hypothetical protein
MGPANAQFRQGEPHKLLRTHAGLSEGELQGMDGGKVIIKVLDIVTRSHRAAIESGQEWRENTADYQGQGKGKEMRNKRLSSAVVWGLGIVFVLLSASAGAQSTQESFGGRYADLEPDQEALIDDWVRRFKEVTGQDVSSEYLYDNVLRLSTRTTFHAVTHALRTTELTDASGAPLGTALGLVEHIETVHGKLKGAPGDHQFRIYVVLKPGAVETLKKSREFKRRADNTIYHKGYPINYRQQGGVPSIQISMATDGKHADIDVDYRASSFPAALINGHLTAANSDVRAGNNQDRHDSRWSGFQNWWAGLFGIRLQSDYADTVVDDRLQFPQFPRKGKETIDEATYDFLKAWLVEGNVAEAVAYVSERAYPCVALERGLESVDRGMAPFMLMMGMQKVKEAVGPKNRLEDITLGVRLTNASFKLVRQDHHAQFVLYSVPDDVAAAFDCSSRSTIPNSKSRQGRDYGNYFGATFYIMGPQGKGQTVALLWGKEGGYWKIVSYEVEPEEESKAPDLRTTAAEEAPRVRVEGDESFKRTSRDFLRQLFIEKDYDAAFRHLSPKSYSCYNVMRGPDRPEARSPEEAARFIREGLGNLGSLTGDRSSLDEILQGVEPVSPTVRIVTHPEEDAFTMVSFPNPVAKWADCATRARGEAFPDDIPLEYGDTYGIFFRLRTEAGETPVLKTLWVKEAGAWKITAYDVELP